MRLGHWYQLQHLLPKVRRIELITTDMSTIPCLDSTSKIALAVVYQHNGELAVIVNIPQMPGSWLYTTNSKDHLLSLAMGGYIKGTVRATTE